MSFKLILVLLALTGIIGMIAGYLLRWLVSLGQRGSVDLEIKQMMLEAREEAKNIIARAEEKAQTFEGEAEAKKKKKEEAYLLKENRLGEKEVYLDKRELALNREAEMVEEKKERVRKLESDAERLLEERENALSFVSHMTKEEAKEELFQSLKKNHEEDLLVRLQKLELEGEKRFEEKARKILTTAIHRLGNAVNAEVFTLSIPLPSEDFKGKIIGKEGRNIRAFERETGVDVLIDDTPGVITLSSFDPVRRQVAKRALESLITDQRIQPARIEAEIKKAREEVAEIMKQKAQSAAFECGIHDLDPKLLSLLGRLHYRTSYGQNVLQHSIEMAHLAGMIAEELGADVFVAKAGALLHDIGKSVDHAVQGTHVEIGIRILERFSVDKRIIQAMQSHHEEYPYETVESIIVQVADALSGGRPGARRDTIERYIERLSDLEAIANSFPGVEKSFAISAGREIRVFVTPEEVSDLSARELARNIALRIENEIKYPGEIKVTVIRENRVIDYAR